MASNVYRNGTGSRKGAMRPLAATNSSNVKSSSFKSRIPPSSNHSPGSAPLRRSNSAGGSDGGFFFHFAFFNCFRECDREFFMFLTNYYVLLCLIFSLQCLEEFE